MYVAGDQGYRPLIVACLVGAVLCFTQFGYIHVKAQLAQVLIAESWSSVLRGDAHPPWPWADAVPVAKLGINQSSYYVLSGAHGTSLAFGPGHVHGSAFPGEPGDAMIAGHRDTHFYALKDAYIGQAIDLQTIAGKQRFHVRDIRIVDTRIDETHDLWLTGPARLVLVTCYPFDVAERGPLRLVVTAE